MNPRITLRIAAIRRREAAADKACPSLLRVRSHAERVLCDTDLHAKPLIPRRYEKAASIAAYSVLMVFLLIACFMFGGAEPVFFEAAR